MALTKLRVRLARPMVGSDVAERPMACSCVATVDASVAEFGVRRMYLGI